LALLGTPPAAPFVAEEVDQSFVVFRVAVFRL
jgi:hypothetical protein